MADSVRLIITGGTIDSTWDGRQDTAVLAEHSVVPNYIEKLGLSIQVKFTEVCMKDSRALTTEDLQKVVQVIESCEETSVLITHGIFTMPDTAKFLSQNIKRQGATVILTGSSTPLKGFDLSDAPFNLGYAFSRVQTQEPGVYISLNGQIYSADEVQKSLAEGKFYSVFADKQ